MRALAAMLSWDIRLQARYHIYTAVAFSTAGYIAIVGLLPNDLPPGVIAFLIFAEAGIVGFPVVGALMLFERNERTLSAVAIAPCPAWVYLASKTISLTLASMAAGYALAALAFPGDLDTGIMLAGLALTAAVAVLVGIGAVGGARSLNQYMVRAAAVMIVFAIPLATLTGAAGPWQLAFLPTQASLTLLLGAAAPDAVSRAEWIYAPLYLLVWVAVAWVWARRTFDRHVLGEGQ